ncbi:MAG: sensor histidine kinase [Chloroflexi bacterium]|nr:sensor histidine kinase [Chloroflexota bacterium]
MREYAAQAEELATARERNRLAREIHDGLGHYLTVINVQIEAARAVMESDAARAASALSKAQSLAKEGLADVRRSVAALRASPIENRPLAEAIAALVEECRAAGLRADFLVNGATRRLAPQAELTLYRAAQEGLTNVRKHAHASFVSVTLDYDDPARVRLTVKDNGGGGGNANGGFGLIGVRERAQLLGGQMKMDTGMGEGFALEVELPTNDER